MSNKTYDTMKLISLLIAPACTFIAAIVNIWNIPYGTQIVATIAAADALMGAIVVIAKKIYDKDNSGVKEEESNG